MRNAQPTRRRLEAMADDLDFDLFEADVLAPAGSVVELLELADELAGVGDLLAELDDQLAAQAAELALPRVLPLLARWDARRDLLTVGDVLFEGGAAA